MNKCCGTCKHWSEVSGLVAREGSCQKAWAVPSVSNTRLVGPNDGQDCPLYEAKDGEKK